MLQRWGWMTTRVVADDHQVSAASGDGSEGLGRGRLRLGRSGERESVGQLRESLPQARWVMADGVNGGRRARSTTRGIPFFPTTAAGGLGVVAPTVGAGLVHGGREAGVPQPAQRQ